jgi:tRNA A37 methylthiotransferase MiaB
MIVRTFRAAFPMVTLSTDVICGFPGESEVALNNTLDLIKEVQPDIVNVSKFFARPNTAAAGMTEGLVGQQEIKRRSNDTAKTAKRLSLERNQRWRGWSGTILIDEKGKVPGSWVGRNFAYKPIIVKSGSNLLGKTLAIRVRDAFSTYLEGEIAD